MKEEIRLTRNIHYFVRGQLGWEESLRLLDEIVESEEWMKHLEIDMLLYKMACKRREKTGKDGKRREKAVDKPPIPIFY